MRIVLIVVLGLLLGVAGAFALLPEARERVAQMFERVPVVGKAAVGGPFSLIDHNGKRVTDKDFRGRYMLVYFGYTFCPDVCPQGLQVISAALDKIGPKAKRVAPIFITVDPERDTLEYLKPYIESFHPSFVGLTGTSAEIGEVARAYRVYYKLQKEDATSTDYLVDHTSIVYLMDPDGAFVTHFSHATSVDAMAEKLQNIL